MYIMTNCEKQTAGAAGAHAAVPAAGTPICSAGGEALELVHPGVV